ncbi:MAG: GGDEF domain-containing protein [Gammaproteobacteria bacterium]|nr:GGDEF domain-containing protein [Gammaproteobacteria bacterium]MCF6230109.1 GGDEF domain-containing protein [Gammaproteobacteria bacterium]
MSTAIPFVADTLTGITRQHKKNVVVNRARIEAFSDQASQFTGLLQTSLELPVVLNIFAEQTEKVLPFAGITYTSAESKEDITIGERGRHSCSYRLTLETETLGEICISRRQHFSEDDLELFEKLIALLLYPLRNCLQFQKATKAASKDPLTGLDNRRSMDEHIAHESKLALRYGNPLAMLVLDIDHFKRINDNHGHKAGDCLIKAFADVMISTARTTDYAFRYGGEEFVMLLPNTSPEGAMLVAERMRQTVEQTKCICHGETLTMTISIGASYLTSQDRDDSLFLRADDALYKAKNSGRNRVCSSA